MIKNDKLFLKQKYKIDVDKDPEKLLNKKIIEIIKNNNKMIKLKQEKNRLLREKISMLFNDE